MADGSYVSHFLAYELECFKALSCWHRLKSQLMFAVFVGFVLTISVVAYMMRCRGSEEEPEPEDRDTESQMEPSTEPQTSRYPSNVNSLGMKLPGIFADAAFSAEGVLIWLHHRCHARIIRDNKPPKNTERLEGLSQMIHLRILCMDNRSNEEVKVHLKESLISMNDFVRRRQVTTFSVE